MKNIEVGVPQGSCLDPLPFLVYIKPFSCIIKNSNASMHADDTSVYHSSKDTTE